MFRRLRHIGNLIRNKRVADPTRPFTGARFVVMDTELTGLDEKRDSIVSIGAVRMTGGVIDLGDTFYQLVNPETALSASSVVIHEITPSEVAAKPPIDAVLAEYLAFASDDILIGHFVSLDLAFLNREMRRVFKHELRNPVLDTLSIYEWLSRRLKPHAHFKATPPGYRLYDIAKCFDIPMNVAHNAIADAYTTAQLFQRFLPLLTEVGINTLDELIRIGTPFQGNQRFGVSGEFSNF
jgi:DNA polymerase III subunit epsilon